MKSFLWEISPTNTEIWVRRKNINGNKRPMLRRRTIKKKSLPGRINLILVMKTPRSLPNPRTRKIPLNPRAKRLKVMAGGKRLSKTLTRKTTKSEARARRTNKRNPSIRVDLRRRAVLVKRKRAVLARRKVERSELMIWTSVFECIYCGRLQLKYWLLTDNQ